MLTPNDKKILGRAQQAALDALKQAGDKGVTTMEGIAVAGSRFPARCHDLRQIGYIIKTERISGDRLEFRYKLLGYNADPQLLLFMKAA